MMKYFILIVHIVVFYSSYSQGYINYYNIVNEAEINHLDKQYHQSDSLYRLAFGSVDKPFKEDFFNASVNSTYLRDNQKTYEYLKKAVLKGLNLKRIKGFKKEFKDFKKSDYWKTIQNEYNILNTNFFSTLNITLREEIETMIRKDQRARTPILTGARTMDKADSDNFKRLKEIIKENNNEWPGFSLIGEMNKNKYDVDGSIVLILLHLNRKELEEIKPVLRKAVLDGEMYPYHYARVVDYTFPNGDLCQYYGSYLNMAVCDCNKAEEERKKIGFEPLEDYFRKRNVSFTCEK